ncbi:hypothetical protein J7U46_02640 [Pelomonas sp. V22]|uniref:CsgG/HfaB family protein n=1 Tax=Pelomonas sp. V22 TaxID=2822139 RepID=UPI0024A91962|nr:CsgG/HfaB family protein [Pelomonas sp. V22]MDI4631939.1 hypothetical protein [Pelomonas sp. V22]
MKRQMLVLVAGLMLAAAAARAESDSKVETCAKKLGTIAVVEPQQGWHHISSYGLGSPAALLRLMIQKSGCFDVVERGQAMANIQQERALAAGGDLRAESNVGKGQMQAADFVMTPNVQVGSSNTGGIGGFLGGKLGVLGAIAGSLKFKEASTSLMVADVRSSIQVAAAEGKASKTDFGIGGWGFGGGVVGGLGGYTSTPEGKMVAAGFLDNYNKIVLEIRDKEQLIRTSSASSDVNAAGSTKAEAPQPAGQVLHAKIANVKVYAEASRESKVVATLSKNDDLVASGEVKNGFAFVDAANFSGWVQRTLVGAEQQTAAAPQPPVVQPVGTGIAGQFSGNFGGADQGSFQVSVSANGLVRGQGVSNATGAFSIVGRVDPSGQLNLAATGNAGAAIFSGRIDGASGALSGTWRFGGAPGSGTFSGQRM